MSGQVEDRPWGVTVATLWSRGLTGRLRLNLGSERFTIAFVRGAVVGATSPLIADSAAELAIEVGLVERPQLPELLARQHTRDDVELVTAHVAADRALAFRRHAIARRAARTFAFDEGEFTVEETPLVVAMDGCALDTRSVIYLGARTMIADERLTADLRRLGERFRLVDESNLAQLGMDAPLDKLRRGCTLDELTTHDERAVTYALVCAKACVAETRRLPQMSRLGMPYAKRDTVSPDGVPARRATPQSGVLVPRAATPTSVGVPVQRAPHAPATNPHSPEGGVPVAIPKRETDRFPRKPTPAYGIPHRRPATTPYAIRDVATAKLLDELTDRLARGVESYALFGLPEDATPEALRHAYLEIARLLRPSLGHGTDAQHVFARVSGVFAILADPSRQTGPYSVVEDTAKAAYCRGELALGTGKHAVAVEELSIATELEPNRAEYLALLAWARFCACPDKQTIAEQTRRALTDAMTKTPNPVVPTFYLACVARALEKDRDALRLFQRVLHLDPEHREARREVTALVQRLEKRGLFDRFRR